MCRTCLASARLSENLIALPPGFLICAPLCKLAPANSSFCFLQRHSETAGAYILFYRILCTAVCLCVAGACLLRKQKELLTVLRQCVRVRSHPGVAKQRFSEKPGLSGSMCGTSLGTHLLFWGRKKQKC